MNYYGMLLAGQNVCWYAMYEAHYKFMDIPTYNKRNILHFIVWILLSFLVCVCMRVCVSKHYLFLMLLFINEKKISFWIGMELHEAIWSGVKSIRIKVFHWRKVEGAYIPWFSQKKNSYIQLRLCIL